MPVLKGSFLSARPRVVNFKTGRRAGESRDSYQLAFIPRNDPHHFPTVMSTDAETFDALNFAPGDMIEVRFIETTLDERICVGVTPVSA